MNIILSTLNAKYIHSSLALRYLRTSLTISAKVHIKEYTINNHLPDILGDIFDNAPDVVCFACYIWNIEQTVKLVAMIKKVLPACTVILGGPEVSYNARAILKNHASVDYVIMGEGEAVLQNTLSSLLAGENAADIPGLVWRDGNEVAACGGPQIIQDLNTLPFPYAGEPLEELHNKIIYYESSRGCPFGCHYCLSSVTRGVRFLSVERVLAELDYFIRHRVKQVKFVDRTYNVNKNHFLPIMKHLAAQDCMTNFHFEITADLLDEEVLAFLSSVPPGRFQFEIGVQSTNPVTLKHVGRKNDWECLKQVVKVLKSRGNIHLHLDLIAGLPYEDFHSFRKSFNDVYSLEPDVLQLGFLKLLHGSPLRQRINDYGYIATDDPPYEVLSNHCITYRELRTLKIIEDIFESIYNSNRFKTTVQWFVSLYQKDAFAFFNDLAGYWRGNGLHLISHSPQALGHYLENFCHTRYPEQALICSEMLKYDLLLDKGQIHDDKLQTEKSLFFKDEKKVREYYPDYKFTNWRDVQNKYRLMSFTCDIPHFIATGEVHKATAVILFVLHDHGVQTINVSKDELFNEI